MISWQTLTRGFFVGCILLACICTSPAQLEQLIDEYMTHQVTDGSPGGAILVVSQGKTLVAKGYGLASLEHGIPFTEHTVSDIGSVAKQFTCFAVNLLREQNKIKSLKDPITDYLDYFPSFGADISILDLMMHTSGLREIYSIQALQGHRGSDGIRQSDAAKIIQRSEHLNFAPGTEFMYCNTAYMVLADLIESVSGSTYEDWMTEHIFARLGMDDTYVMDVQGEVFADCAESYLLSSERQYRRIFDNSTAYGQGGIYTSLVDLGKWLEFIAHPQDRPWCKASTIADLRSTEEIILSNGEPATYAKGLTTEPYRGLDRVGHTGSSAGYRTTLQYFPQLDLGIAVKTNTPGLERQPIIDLVLEHLTRDLDPVAVDSQTESDCGMESSATQAGERLVGTYYSPEYGALYDVKIVDGQLMLDHALHNAVALHALGGGSYCSPHWFLFQLDFLEKDGTVVGFNAQGDRVRDVFFEKIR